MKRFLRPFALALGLCLGVTGLAACSDNESASGPTGNSDGALVIYSGRHENLIKPVIDKFTEQTGIATEVRYAGSPELAAQLLEEGDSTNADVFISQDAGALGAAEKAGLLGPIDQAQLDRVDPRFRSDTGQWIGISGRARVIAYNPTLVQPSELPSSVFDVTDPKWKGRVGIAPANASFQAFVTGMRLTAGEERTMQFLENLKANDPKIYANNIQTLDAVDNGEVALGLVNHYYLYQRINERGAENVTARNHFLGNGDPGALVNVAGAGILKGTNDRQEANRFVEYLLSMDAQTYFRDKTFEYPVIPEVESAPGVPALETVNGPKVDLSDLDSLDRTQTMLREAGLI